MVELKLKLPETFFQDEYRDGYFVSKSMKEIWAIQLDMLNEFDLFCNNHGIKYYLCGGSLLGAIRHKGYIPWDDDIDVILFREEYNKVLKLAPSYFKYPYFYQNAYTDKGYIHGHSQLRRSDTCGILLSNLDPNMFEFNMGIFIDIFVFDYIPDDEKEKLSFIKELDNYKKKLKDLGNWKILNHTHIKLLNIFEPFRYLYKRYKYGSLQSFFRRFEECAQKYNDTDLVQNIMFIDKYSFKSEWFDHIYLVPFENLMLPIPSKYIEVLSAQFGSNFMIPLKKKGYHGNVLFDTSKTYIYYLDIYKKGLL